ncbi:MAG: hypothetical protein HYX71_11165 [Opitutae bacterium]|nr:hypothetical protein [Opitutae bacterium]
MTKVQLLSRDIRRKRREITGLQEDLTNMHDHLAVLEARAKNVGKPTYSSAEVRARLALTGKK